MACERPDDIDLQVARELWRKQAVMQGILCMGCSEAPALEHRDVFFDTGLCEACSEPAEADARFA
jgi:hypothetical protein